MAAVWLQVTIRNQEWKSGVRINPKWIGFNGSRRRRRVGCGAYSQWINLKAVKGTTWTAQGGPGSVPDPAARERG